MALQPGDEDVSSGWDEALEYLNRLYSSAADDEDRALELLLRARENTTRLLEEVELRIAALRDCMASGPYNH